MPIKRGAFKEAHESHLLKESSDFALQGTVRSDWWRKKRK
jgi:hypothetical protein